jgi:ABC-type spermidine/putrescine transport system permease subunit II
VAVDVPRSLATVAIGHTVIATPYATLILLARLGGLDPALEDAAMDLGATYPATLRRVVVPLIGPTLLSAWLDLPNAQRNEMDAEFRDIF